MHADWEGLIGQRVCVYNGTEVIRTGTVDAVTPSGDILWIRSDGADGRTIYERAEGYYVVSV